MTVKLNFAFSEHKYFYIDDRLPKDKLYTCPFCGEKVIPKKGKINEHHFAHKPNSSCTATEETILHFNAKHYLLLNRDRDIKINFPSTFFTKLTDFLKNLDIEEIPVKLKKILESYYLEFEDGKVERKIGNFIADVLFISPEDNFPLVIEILVTHPMEEEKRTYFKSYDIPYLELKPVSTSKGFQYYVNDYYLHDFIDEYQGNAFHVSINSTFNAKKEQLISIAKQELIDSDQLKLHKETALDEIFRKADSLNFREYINGKIFKDMKSIPVTAHGRAESAERLSSIHYSGKSLKANGYYVNREKAILFNLINSFRSEGIEIEVFKESDYFSKRSYVTGFNFLIPSETFTKEVLTNIIKSMIKQLRDEM